MSDYLNDRLLHLVIISVKDTINPLFEIIMEINEVFKISPDDMIDFCLLAKFENRFDGIINEHGFEVDLVSPVAFVFPFKNIAFDP